MPFDFDPPDGYRNLARFPTTPASEAEFRDSMQRLLDQLRDEMNRVGSLGAGVEAMSRQAIINGNFDVWQRGNSFVNPIGYTADRWLSTCGADGGILPNITDQKVLINSGDVPGAFYAYRTQFAGASNVGANGGKAIYQRIEFGTRYLAGGGKKITVSFWAKSDLANKRLGIALSQRYGSGGAPAAAETIPGQIVVLTPNWTQYEVTFTLNTLAGKAFGTNNDDYLQIGFHSLWGDASGASVLGGAAAENVAAAGSVDVSQVQFNAGDQAIPFQPRSFAEELALCQRYYERFDSAGAARLNISTVSVNTATVAVGQIFFKVEKRVNPTMTQGGGFRLLPNGIVVTISFQEQNKFQTAVVAGASGLTVSQSYQLQTFDTGGWIAADAEL